jgi:hypothetical protein
MKKESRIINGKLIFFDLSTIVIIDSENFGIDLAFLLKDFLYKNNGKLANFDYQVDGFILKIDESFNKKLVWRKYTQTTLERINSFGVINFSTYARIIFESLNARLVNVELTSDSFEIYPDISEDTNGIYFCGDGNLCRVDRQTVERKCRINIEKSETCVFLIEGSSDFKCCKFSSLARVLLARLKENNMDAQRIGNCRCLGVN